MGMDGLSVHLYSSDIYMSWAVCLLWTRFLPVSGCVVNQRDLTAIHHFHLWGGTHMQLSRTCCNRFMPENHFSSEIPCWHDATHSKEAKSPHTGQCNRHQLLVSATVWKCTANLLNTGKYCGKYSDNAPCIRIWGQQDFHGALRASFSFAISFNRNVTLLPFFITSVFFRSSASQRKCV